MNEKINVTLEKKNGVCKLTYGYENKTQQSSHPITEEDKEIILGILNKYARKITYTLD